ncbi:potassium/proton antiporter [Cetobacterium sp. SF1]|uniref:potassium/proton antiporter n=1 Tax=Cetobacterium sp. SF1 TaxID=3417654 RepID=UPI003CE7052A
MNTSLLIVGIIVVFSLLSMRISKRFEIPLLIMFILVGMLAGSEGIGGIYFDDAKITQDIGTVALIFIIFSGGLETKKADVKSAFFPSSTLATAGVLLTAIFSTAIVYSLTNFTLRESLLFSAMVSSTDAAAVMYILEDTSLIKKVRSVVEIESGSNDPMAYALILFLISFFKSDSFSLFGSIFFLLKQIGFGIICGVFFGKITLPLGNFIKIFKEEFLTIYLSAMAFITFGATSLIDGNGYLAIYIAAILIGNEKFNFKVNNLRNMKLITGLMQISMFVILGLLVFPSQLYGFIFIGSLLSILVIIGVRMLVVFLLLHFFDFTIKEKFFISWAGLKGAVPIIFATMAITEGLPNSQTMFNLIFYMVAFSVTIQGVLLKPLGKYLNLFQDQEEDHSILSMDELEELTIKKITLDKNSEYAFKEIKDLNLPHSTLIISIKRKDTYITPKGDIILLPKDIILFSEKTI